MSDIEEQYQQLMNEPVDPETVKNAVDVFVPRTGKYVASITHKKKAEAGERSPWPGRLMFNVRVQLFDQDGNKKGALWASMSPSKVKNDRGQLDPPSRLWGQFIIACGMQGQTVGEVFESLDLFQYNVYVKSSFKTPEGWKAPTTQEERNAYLSAGYTNKAFLQSVSPVK